MLYLIGLGLADDDISMRGLKAIKKCDAVYCEIYTSTWGGDLKKLEKKTKKKIKILARQEVESDFLTSEARKKNIALLVPGDPLSATTHFQLVLDAKAKRIRCEIIHASSIYTAVAETGLQLYKFGRTTTLAYPEKNFSPTSPYDVVEKNRALGLHTLVLLDIKKEKEMTVKGALEILMEISSKKKKKIITKETQIVACCRLGGKGSTIKFGKAINLMHDKSMQATPAVLIVPGKLNFKEEEALELWK